MGSKGSKGKKKTTQLSEDEINLLLSNTSFTREEIFKWHEGFIVSSICSRILFLLLLLLLVKIFCFK